ncbi:hydroxyacid dehydrogenase [Sphingomonas sp.]|uniref:hydroxyacid dehydrogenase n=1 Tax=Sphingomonas sp. TaxID=28214 RepID=UPI0035C7B2B2
MGNHCAITVGGELAPAAVQAAERRGVALVSSKAYPSDDELVAAANDIGAQALIVRMGRVSRDALARIPTMKVVVKHGVGFDTIDVRGAAALDIPVLVAGGANAQSVAEQALALLMSVARSTPWLDRRLRDGEWDKSSYAGIEITGRSVGLVGLGAIGRAFLHLLTPFDVIARVFDPYLQPDQVPAGVELVDNLQALLAQSDVVSLHCPLTEENRGLIGAEALGTMKPDAILINTARGGLVDEAALVAALRNGTIRGAGLDTFAQEPPGRDNPLWTLPNLVASPHVGANTVEARARVGISCVEQVADYLDRGALDARNHVNAAARLAA